MFADALAPCVTRSSATIILTIHDKQAYLSQGRISAAWDISLFINQWKYKYFFMFLELNLAWQMVYDRQKIGRIWRMSVAPHLENRRNQQRPLDTKQWREYDNTLLSPSRGMTQHAGPWGKSHCHPGHLSLKSRKHSYVNICSNENVIKFNLTFYGIIAEFSF